jgi:hypothetical protein
MNHTSIRVAAIAAAAGLTLLAAPSVATADPPPGPVDESRLVPSLSQTFAPWTCVAKQTGPVCTGHWQVTTGWGPADFPCAVPIYANSDFDRRSTRYYNWDYLNYDRYVHQNDIDHLSTSPDGPVTATISTTGRFREPFATPGDDKTFTVISEGVPWDIRSAQGPSLFRAVGTIVEPPGQVGTFTGHVTDHGVTTRYENAPLTQVLPDENFLSLVCEAATGQP